MFAETLAISTASLKFMKCTSSLLPESSRASTCVVGVAAYRASKWPLGLAAVNVVLLGFNPRHGVRGAQLHHAWAYSPCDACSWQGTPSP